MLIRFLSWHARVAYLTRSAQCRIQRRRTAQNGHSAKKSATMLFCALWLDNTSTMNPKVFIALSPEHTLGHSQQFPAIIVWDVFHFVHCPPCGSFSSSVLHYYGSQMLLNRYENIAGMLHFFMYDNGKWLRSARHVWFGRDYAFTVRLLRSCPATCSSTL